MGLLGILFVVLYNERKESIFCQEYTFSLFVSPLDNKDWRGGNIRVCLTLICYEFSYPSDDGNVFLLVV